MKKPQQKVADHASVGLVGRGNGAKPVPPSGLSTALRRALPGQRGQTNVVIPRGQQDEASLLKTGIEWLIPLLVRDFLQERGIEPYSPVNHSKFRPDGYRKRRKGARV